MPDQNFNDSFRPVDSSFDSPDPFAEATAKSRLHILPFVLLGGLLTSLLVLIAAGFVSWHSDIDPLSILLGPIPVGALILGLLAGSGYAIVGRLAHFRVSLFCIFVIFLLQIALFFGGRYVNYLIARGQYEQVVLAMVDSLDRINQLEQNPDGSNLSNSEDGVPESDVLESEDAILDAVSAADPVHDESSTGSPSPDAANTDTPADTNTATDTDTATVETEPAATDVPKSDVPEATVPEATVPEATLPFNRQKALDDIMAEMPSFVESYRGMMTGNSLQEIGKEADPNNPPAELGFWGYALEVLTILVFAFNSILGLLIVYSFPYCVPCGRYMSCRKTITLPARMPVAKFKRKEAEAKKAYLEQDRARFANAMAQIRQLADQLPSSGTDSEARARILSLLQQWEVPSAENALQTLQKSPNWILIEWFECRECDNWSLKVRLMMNPQDSVCPKRVRSQRLITASKTTEAKVDIPDPVLPS